MGSNIPANTASEFSIGETFDLQDETEQPTLEITMAEDAVLKRDQLSGRSVPAITGREFWNPLVGSFANFNTYASDNVMRSNDESLLEFLNVTGHSLPSQTIAERLSPFNCEREPFPLTAVTDPPLTADEYGVIGVRITQHDVNEPLLQMQPRSWWISEHESGHVPKFIQVHHEPKDKDVLFQEARNGADTVRKRKRVDIKNRSEIPGPNKYGRKGTLICGQCRARNSKCNYDSKWAPCEYCRVREIDTPCFKLPGPKTAALKPPTWPLANSDLRGEDVLLLQSMYAEERAGPLARSLIRQFAITYGTGIRSTCLRSAILAYAAVLLPPSQFGEISDRHASTASNMLMLKLQNPQSLDDSDAFAASMLMWRLWVRNLKDVALVHAKGVMGILDLLWTRNDGFSDILDVFGPLAYSDAKFYVSMSEHSDFSDQPRETQRRITFKQRVKYHREIISSGGPAIVWCSSVVQALADTLWDIQRVLLELALDIANGGWERYSESDSRVQYLWSEYNDVGLQQTILTLANSTGNDFEGEVTTYLLQQRLSIQLLITVIKSASILKGLRSFEAIHHAKEQFLRAKSRPLQRDGEAFQIYTWAFVLCVGLAGLVFGIEDESEARQWVSEELKLRDKTKLRTLLETFWANQNPEAAKSVLERIYAESSRTKFSLEYLTC